MEALPSVGRILHYYQSPSSVEYAAIICGVHHETLVNLVVFDREGRHSAVLEVPLVPWGTVAPQSGHFAKWPMSPTLAKLSK